MKNTVISYPNQKYVKVRRKKVEGSKDTYLNIYTSSVISAMKDLSNSAFKVYIYLVSNRDGYEFYLSPAAIHNETGVCIDTVRKALRELEAKEYIKLVETNQYEFKEEPYM